MKDVSNIRSRLTALRGKVATALAVDGAARLAGVLLAVIAISFTADRIFKLEIAARVVVLLAMLGALGWTIYRYLVRRLTGVPGEDPLAIAVERRFPELGDRLISALQLARETDPERYGMSPQLVEDAIEEAIEPATKVRFSEILATARIGRHALLGVLALALLTGGAIASPENASIWFRRNVLLGTVRWPQKTYLEIDPERFPNRVARIVRGEDIVVTAHSVGEIHPDRVTILYRDDAGDSGKATMKADVENHIYRFEFKEVGFPISFHLEGGDEETDEYRIELMEAPEVAELEIRVGFPAYAEREPVIVDLSQGDPEMLRGGKVMLRGTSTKPLQGAELVIGEGDEQIVTATITGPTSFEVEFQPEETLLAGIRLLDADGLSNPSLAPRFLVRVVEDRAPRVRLLKRGIGTMVVEGASFPYTVRVRDDVRAMTGRIAVKKTSVDGAAPEPQSIPLAEDSLGVPETDVLGTLEISSLNVGPGTFLTFNAFVLDNAQPDAHEGKSDPLSLKVVTLEELLQNLLRRQHQLRQRFEDLIKAEKALMNRYLDVRDQPPTDPQELMLHIESYGQSQREIGRGVRAVERSMSQILDEMLNNRVSTRENVEQLRREVVTSLIRLRNQIMEPHARDLDLFARRATATNIRGEEGDAVKKGFDRVLAAMMSVLAKLEKAETFTEIIERMRVIMKLHEEVRESTRKKHEDALREIFGPEKKPPAKKDE
ncbi:MAG: hypothetical protein ACYS0E_10070 [Planctomycetota bacterium]|jgi:hypothetical protein